MIFSISFIFYTLLCLLFFYWGTDKHKRVFMVAFVWLLIISALSLQDFFQNTSDIPPRFLFVLLGNVTLILYFYRILKTTHLSYSYSLLIHTLRIPVEIALYYLFLQGEVPEIMTFKGWNFDVFMGISAFILFISSRVFKYKATKTILLCWNVTGIILLLSIVVIAILSAPLPFQQLAFDQPNIAVLRFPFVFLPSIIVPIVLLTHILSIKQLMED